MLEYGFEHQLVLLDLLGFIGKGLRQRAIFRFGFLELIDNWRRERDD